MGSNLFELLEAMFVFVIDDVKVGQDSVELGQIMASLFQCSVSTILLTYSLFYCFEQINFIILRKKICSFPMVASKWK